MSDKGVEVENHGAAIQRSLQALPEGGLSLVTRIMSILSVAAAAIVVFYALLTILLGMISSMSVPFSWSIGDTKPGTEASQTRFTTGAHVTSSLPAEKQLDMNCPELTKKTGADLSKCAWLPHKPSADDIAAANKAKQTPGNWFNAAIRPVFWSLPVFLLAIGLVEAARCLNGLAQGRYFSADTVTHLRNFAIAGLLYVLLTPCMPAVANLFCNIVIWIDTLIVRTWPPHHPYTVSMPTSFEANAVVGGVRMFSGFLIGLYAFTLAIIATVMARASAVVEDHAEII